MKTVAAIGTGNIFETAHYPFFAPHCQWVAVADSDGERARQAARKYGIPHAFASAQAMLESVQPDIVCVGTPNKYHYPMVMLAIAHGCHVFCEKPPAMNGQQAQEMMQAAQQKGVLLAYDLHHRFSPNVTMLKEQIDAGVLGRLYHGHVQALRRRGVPGWGSFIDKEIQGGGPLIDIGIHMLDVALYLMGQPRVKSVLASSYAEIGPFKSKGTFGSWDPAKYTVEDSLFAFVIFENGASLTLETAFALNMQENKKMNVLLHGSEAGASVFPLALYGEKDGEPADTLFPATEEGGYQRAVEHFLARLRGEDVMLADAASGLYLQSLIDDMYQSAETGKVVCYG